MSGWRMKMSMSGVINQRSVASSGVEPDRLASGPGVTWVTDRRPFRPSPQWAWKGPGWSRLPAFLPPLMPSFLLPALSAVTYSLGIARPVAVTTRQASLSLRRWPGDLAFGQAGLGWKHHPLWRAWRDISQGRRTSPLSAHLLTASCPLPSSRHSWWNGRWEGR